ncbi:hypothetical protein AAG602_15865 [Citromicrobium bathyomarinum]|uniref:hypothetical protein n=1 Tax=unclassified Citromicrobium TaxID=2630544 RepID=UPI0006C8FF0F|nr:MULTISPECIES: hypothetical protein [unclassified Citromicrobium]KPM22426.1 hypothetical protein AAJ72_11020 [Citromicrobium sp. RCC1885]KPM25909.1 hypothetical protein AAJ74_11760 [Citromicrobium sp. RCC1878]MAO04239.1 hypothetical protein [Citromicrobium sp.]OAM08015.1 hypothetical protein A0U43_12405 [Citromicrobium sp. RCC1897]|tara:strand:+ start:170 stop:829 length:660 start_codon:yes stop_codon:yes gene_type:complete
MLKRSLILAVASVALLGTGLAVAPVAPAAAQSVRSTWSIGPVVRGKNSSYRMPATMQDTARGAMFDFPYPSPAAGHVHYVTTATRPLAGAKRITMRYRIDAARGVRFVPEEDPQNTATLSLYFQRAGDRWTMRTPHHRWYAPNEKVIPLSRGTHEVSIDLDEEWIAMVGGTSYTLPEAFERALDRTAQVGFVFGSPALRGHGVYATGPARFTLLDFRIE